MTPVAGAPAIPAALATEIDVVAAAIARFRSGAMSDERFKQFRLAYGIYGQRQPGVQMIRVKIPAGALNGRQLEAIARLGVEFSSGMAHLTTRQDIQFHFVPLDRVPDLLRGLAAAGFTTREACGNNVRNTTACPLSGEIADELFEVRPFALAASEFLVRNPFCQQMSRKFKIAFSGCPEDCAATAIHDIGALARLEAGPDGRPQAGFRLLVGGGLGAAPFVAHTLREFVPAGELLVWIKSALLVFADQGNRRVRTKARIKFVVHRLGIERFRALVDERRATLTAEELEEATLLRWVPAASRDEVARLLAGQARGAGEAAPRALDLPATAEPAFRRWHAGSVRAHRDPGRAVVTLQVPLGDLKATTLVEVARLVPRFGDDRVRVARDQNLVLPSVRRADLPALHRALAAIGLAEASAGTALDVVACPGADTCALGITSSKGLARAIRDALQPLAEGPEAAALHGVTIKISGCPNACGQHHIADIGWHGAAKNVSGHQVPAYQMHLGGSTGPGTARIGAAMDKVPARQVPLVVAALLRRYAAERGDGETFSQFVDRLPREQVTTMVAGVVSTPGGAAGAAAASEPAWIDWGATTEFSTGDLGRTSPPPTIDDADPLAAVRADLAQAARYLDEGLAYDALATLNRARYAVARTLLSALGRRPDSDYETACDLRARVIDRGHADLEWDDLHRAFETALRPRTPDTAAVRALEKQVVALAEAAAPAYPILKLVASRTSDAEIPGA